MLIMTKSTATLLLVAVVALAAIMMAQDIYVDDHVAEVCTESDDCWYSSPLAAQNLSHVTVNLINDQIFRELQASQAYMAMYAYFARADVAFRGFAKFFQAASHEEREHAIMFVDYLNLRGGKVYLKKSIDAPAASEWKNEEKTQPSPLKALKDAHKMEREINTWLLALHEQKTDPHLQDFLETHFLNEQVDSIKQLSDWITVLRRLKAYPYGIHQFDEEIYTGVRK